MITPQEKYPPVQPEPTPELLLGEPEQEPETDVVFPDEPKPEAEIQPEEERKPTPELPKLPENPEDLVPLLKPLLEKVLN